MARKAARRTVDGIDATLDRVITILKILVPVVIAIAAIFGYTIAVPDDSTEPSQPVPTATPVAGVAAAPPITVVDGPDKDVEFDDVLPLDRDAQRTVEGASNAAPQTELDDPLREPKDGPAVQNEGPLAGQEFPGCRTRFVQNSSSRRGVKPREIVWHYTVSSNRSGWSDVDGLTAFANQLSSGVSWHFLIDGDGNCNYTVPLNLKAWTQSNANPFSIGIEVIATGREARFPLTDAGERRLLAVTRELGRRFNIPLTRGRVSNCRVVAAGVIQHADLGACGGGHHDIGPFNIQPLIDKLGRSPSRTDIVTCRKLNWWRNAGRPASGTKNAVRRREALEKRGVACLKTGPVIR